MAVMSTHTFRRLSFVMVTCLMLMAGSAMADVINFDDILVMPPNNGQIPDNYGSTALVTVSYASTADPDYGYPAVPYVYWWPAYGDLASVAYSANPHGTMLITFAPITG